MKFENDGTFTSSIAFSTGGTPFSAEIVPCSGNATPFSRGGVPFSKRAVGNYTRRKEFRF